MRLQSLTAIVLGAWCLGAIAAPAPEEKKIDYQKMADKEAWKWDARRATAQESEKRYKGDYDLELETAPKEGGQDNVVIRFLENKKEVFSISGHHQTVFVEHQGIVYYADYNRISSGCAVVAYDLRNKKQLWRSNLKGLERIQDHDHENAVFLELKDGALHVLGKECAGKYVEYVELESGKTVGHRIFKNK